MVDIGEVGIRLERDLLGLDLIGNFTERLECACVCVARQVLRSEAEEGRRALRIDLVPRVGDTETKSDARTIRLCQNIIFLLPQSAFLRQ